MTFDNWLKAYEQKNVFGPNEFGYTADNLRECWNAAVASEREQCAAICENADFGNCWTDDSDYDAGMLKGAQICTDAIRTRSNAIVSGLPPEKC